MSWNWQQPDWLAFRYNAAAMEPLEKQFLLHSGEFTGAFRHIGSDDRDALKIELISDEALKTSAIKGEILDRNSVQSSLLHRFGLEPAQSHIPAAERGISEMMVDLHRTFAKPLTGKVMFRCAQGAGKQSTLPAFFRVAGTCHHQDSRRGKRKCPWSALHAQTRRQRHSTR